MFVTSNRGGSGRGCCDQASGHCGADSRRARGTMDSRAAQRRIRSRKQRDQSSRTDQYDRDHAVISRSGGMDSEGEEIKPITIDCGETMLAR